LAQPTNDVSMKRFIVGSIATAALSCIAAPTSAQPASAGRVEFEVFHDGQPFGTQAVTVTKVNGKFIAESSADLKAKIGPLTVFTYRQTCREEWNDERLATLSCSTTKGGKKIDVEGKPEGEKIHVTNTGKKATAKAVFPIEAIPTAWWSKPRLGKYDMINVETGQALPVDVTHVGRETRDIGGRKIEADHIRVSGTLTVDLWYDDAGRWIDCAFKASGQKMTYRLVSPLYEAPA